MMSLTMCDEVALVFSLSSSLLAADVCACVGKGNDVLYWCHCYLLLIKIRDVMMILCYFSYVTIKFFLTLFIMTNAVSKDDVGVKLFILLDDDDDGGDT